MNEIVSHYKGKTTSQGHKLEVKENAGAVLIGFRYEGEHLEAYDRQVRVARIEPVGDAYSVDWFHEGYDEPSETREYSSKEELFSALDSAIEKKSVEAGPAGS